jgi:DNA-directed RNA polymerase specialized sigma24 family protein
MSIPFPTTHATWLAERIRAAPDEARSHVMERYFEPLCAYARASSVRVLGEPAELVNDFLASRLAESEYLARWTSSGLPLRRWLANGLLTHARNRALTESRRRAHGGSVAPEDLERLAESHETSALLALERAWAVRVMTDAHDRVREELHAEGRGAWWELFRLHSVQGLGYSAAAQATGVPLSSASHVNRVVAMRLRDALRAILERDGIRPDEIERELGLMQELLD